MKESINETVTEVKEVGHIHTCNKCGKQVKVRLGTEDEWNNDIKNFYVDFGYESQFDEQKWSFDLCDNCMLDMVKQFKYVPEGFKIDRYINLTREQHQLTFEVWKTTGEWEELKFKTYEELVEMNGWFNTEYINDVIAKYYPHKPLLNEENIEE